MVAAFPQSKSPSFRKGPRIRDQGFEYAIRGSKTEKWRKTAKERGSDASPAVVTYSVTYFDYQYQLCLMLSFSAFSLSSMLS